MEEQNKETVTISLTRYDEFQTKSQKADSLENKKVQLENEISHLFTVLNQSMRKDFQRMDSAEEFLKENGIKFYHDLSRLDFIIR